MSLTKSATDSGCSIVSGPDPGAFAELAGDVFQQREVLAEQNIKLRTARDLLLPRLMSGELTV
jgi:hypothetical protein